MKRIIVAVIVAYILGIIIGLYETISIILFFFVIFSLLFLIPSIRILFCRNKKKIILLTICVLFGIVYTKFYNIEWYRISNNIEEKNMIAKVVNLEKETEYQKTFKIKILNNNRNKNKYTLLKINKKERISENIKIRFNYYFQWRTSRGRKK